MQSILGILGGMGPLATLSFMENIYHRTPNIRVDSDHIRIISDINVKIPSRTRAVLFNEENPSRQMIESIRGLAGMGANYVAVPCNSAHYFYDYVNPSLPIPWINMLSAVSDYIRLLGGGSALILGGYVTVNKKIYDKYLENTCYLSKEDNELVYALIEDLKLSKKISGERIKKVKQICNDVGADNVILACTELTEVASLFESEEYQIIDSNLVYAEKLIELVLNKNV